MKITKTRKDKIKLFLSIMLPVSITQIGLFLMTFDALGETRVSMVITLISLPINVLLNYVFIFGKWGFPEMGGVGSGVATAITYWVILGITIMFITRIHPFKHYNIFGKLVPYNFKENINFLKIGLPIGLAIFFETSIFAAVTLFMSNYDTITIASHQTAMNFADLLYVMPMSIANALTIAVGFEVGAKRFRDAAQYCRIGTFYSVTIALISGLIILVFRTDIAEIYTNNTEVIAMASSFLVYAVFFQLSDAIMAPIQGVLRGYKDVNVSFVMSFTAFWIIGLPVGYIVANYTSLGAYGYWVGLITGLAIGAIGLTSRLIYIQKKKFSVS